MASTAERMGRLISDLLDVSRFHAGQLPMSLEPTEVLAIVARAVTTAHELAAGHHRLTLDAQGVIPMALLDTTRFEQVLTNLLDNAVKYSPLGGVVRTVVSADDGGILLRVSDSGMGLPDGSAESIFEPFGRAPNAASSHLPGMGLGLYICRSIVERHNGRIWAESPGENQGTVFSVWLPAIGRTDG